MRRTSEIIALVTKETRMDGLRKRRATAGAAKFALSRSKEHEHVRRKAKARRRGVSYEAAVFQDADAAASYAEYEDEDVSVRTTISAIRRELDLGCPVTLIDRDFLPNFDFGRCNLVVVVGPDGLVANTAKYVGDVPIIGVNPDSGRNDGVLLPFKAHEVRSVAERAIAGRARIQNVTLAEVSLNDGQRMLAFNDFFIGRRSHASARYTLTADGRAEPQSSSGIIVSTGAGSTGWLSSICNMTRSIATWTGGDASPNLRLAWDEKRLVWAVREPFISKHSQATLVAGFVDKGSEIVIESLMPNEGVIFSDGIEDDFLEFGSGSIARVSVSGQRANLVVG